MGEGWEKDEKFIEGWETMGLANFIGSKRTKK